MKMIAASIMCADSLHLADELRALEQANVKMLHCDVMDGVFVENAKNGGLCPSRYKKQYQNATRYSFGYSES